ncbi:hypothetical protein E2C01_075514 [Portunus trituberculatus]|uniref:Uncharacterized protein n=1 Tax=Portunus trituberculatus TaxID=210409 RepID=A0A5B7IH88_PORTR|nr:hypothetical protein [Portunus trituberculatus]
MPLTLNTSEGQSVTSASSVRRSQMAQCTAPTIPSLTLLILFVGTSSMGSKMPKIWKE